MAESETANVKPKRNMHPNSLEALKRGREKAFARRAERNLGEKKTLMREARLLEKEEVVKKKVEEIVQLRQKVEAKVQERLPAAKAQPPAQTYEEEEDCPEAVDWKNYYKQKYKAKLSAQKEPDYAVLAREKLRQEAAAHARRMAWESTFPGVAVPF